PTPGTGYCPPGIPYAIRANFHRVVDRRVVVAWRTAYGGRDEQRQGRPEDVPRVQGPFSQVGGGVGPDARRFRVWPARRQDATAGEARRLRRRDARRGGALRGPQGASVRDRRGIDRTDGRARGQHPRVPIYRRRLDLGPRHPQVNWGHNTQPVPIELAWGVAYCVPRLHPAELEAGCVGHAARAPRRIPHDFDADLPDPREALDLAADVLPEDVPHAAARCRHAHVDLDAVALGERHGFAAIDEAEVHEIDRDLRIEHRLQLLPDPLLVEGALRGRGRSRRRLLPERVGVFPGDAKEAAVIGRDRELATQRLRDLHARARGKPRGG